MMGHQFGYARLDQPGVVQLLFHPRKELDSKPLPHAIDYDIIVEGDVRIGARFHMAGVGDPNILFFHGNGEIVSDYDSIGPMYNEHGLNLLAVDYRGYGRSGGTPTVTSMMRDAHVIFKEVQHWLEDAKHTGPLVIMGRSLGSACALELAASYESHISGLIVESGFAYTVPLLNCLGIDTQAQGITEADGFKNIQKIAQFTKPTLIIHAQYDQFIPVTSVEALQSYCAARSKEFQMVPGADHNTIMMRTGKLYFEMIKRFTDKIEGKRQKRFFRRKRTS
ncbi:MAG: alpha/beta fold hydrolase [Deltaproteobacteria bacterium]|nr:alpha/beta fold hydrolase [Deltaproteobacteria bacterium]MBW2019801.1 alpha/beta fold hydrolase [Deltaproteobacteria bacterium]MBW2074606.1 alpha/beta fold hydrolase [Deltaproteobacteria bacterium]